MTDEEKKLWDELVEHASDFLVQDYNAILAADAELTRLREENERFIERDEVWRKKKEMLENDLGKAWKERGEARKEVARLMEVRFNSGSFGPYIFGMDVADGEETTVVSRIEEDGTITVIDESRRRAGGG